VSLRHARRASALVSAALWHAALALAAVAAPGAAWAHGTIAGAGAFYSGALHPLVSPAHLIALLTLGLAIGQRAEPEVERTGAPLAALAVALAIGLSLHAAAGDPDTDRVLLAGAALVGVGVAAAWRWPAPWLVVLAAAVGVAAGLASGPSGVQGSARATMLAGTGLAAFAVTAYAAVMTATIRQPWLQIAVRVLGSWFAAAALLVLALGLAAARRAAGA
jgi:hydrogenase/urease accessory protein HupE